MEHDHLGALLDVPVIVDVDGGDANSATNTTTESPAAGNNGANGDHLVDAEDFKNMKLAIGTVDRTILEISLGLGDNNLTGGTSHVDIRLRPQADVEISGTEQSALQLGTGNQQGPQQQEQQQHKFPPPPGNGSSCSRLIKITVAAAGDEQPDPESDSDAKYLDKMRGWLMTVATLFVGITFQAAIQPPDWTKRWPNGSDSDKQNADASSSSHANNKVVAFKPAEYAGAGLYVLSNSAMFGCALYVVLFLLYAPRTTSSAKQTMDSVRRVMSIYSICLAVTFAMATPAASWASLGFALLVGIAPFAAVVIRLVK